MILENKTFTYQPRPFKNPSDKTTKKFIRWGSDNYISYGAEYHTDLENGSGFDYWFIFLCNSAMILENQIKITYQR